MPIIESNKITDIFKHIDDETLVLFDVDNTLIEPASQLGSVAWFDHLHAKFEKNGLERTEAIMKAYGIWMKAQPIISMKTVETETASVVKQLHENNIKTMGVTGRGFLLAEITDKQLRSVDIAIDANTIHDQRIEFEEHTGFYNGVLSVKPFEDKGRELTRLFKKIDYEPKKILFIDDHTHFLEQVQTIFEHIPFTGIRYGAVDTRAVTFDPARVAEEVKEIVAGTDQQHLAEELLV